MSRCISGKRCFDSISFAEEALIENHIKFNHPDGVGPINVYECRDCGYFHFTSQGEKNPVLIEKSGFIKAQQVARNWENKLRR